MYKRGQIRNKDFARQLNDFSGLRYGNITPTDIDGFIDFQNRLFIFMEGKHSGSKLHYGQRLALERLTDACHNPPGRIATCLIVDHNTPPEYDVNFAQGLVREFRWEGEWRLPQIAGLTVEEAVSQLRGFQTRKARGGLKVIKGGAQ